MKRRQLLPLVLFPSLAFIFILAATIITDESPPPVTSAPSPLVKRSPTRSSAPRSTPPRSSPPPQARCFRTNYDSVCTEIASRNVASRGSVLITPTLKRLCVDNVNDMSTCMYPNTVQFDPPLLPLSLTELREALVAVGGPECVAGPLTLNDVVRTRYDGPGGVPRWSVYRKSCVGKYRDLTRQELLSVLYHYTQHMTSQGVPHAGFVLSGDSMIRSLVHRLVCFFRDVQHCVAMEFDIMYVLRADRDEVVMIHEKRERPHPMLDDQAKLLISLEHRCILAKYFPGFLPEAPPADKCWQHLEGVLVAFMVFWDPLPHKVHYELHKRMPPPPLMLTGFTYWWDSRDPNTPRYHFDTFQKFQEHRFAAFYGRKPSYPTVGEASPAKLPISMYITSPQLRRPHISFIIPWALLESRNEYIRHLPWQKVAHASIPAVNTGGVSPMHQYLLDFDILSRVLLNVSARSDEIHFLCGEDLFEVTEGFLCPDVIDGTMIQWIGHVIAGEL